MSNIVKSAVRDIISEHAHDQAMSVLYYLETMYPIAWAAMSATCRRSLRNTVKSTFRVHAEYVAKAAAE